MTHARDDGVYLVSGQLAAFPRLGTLRHFDLQFLRADQILTRHAEAPGSHLLDGARTRIAVGIWNEARRVFTAFAGVALAADAIHRDGQRFMRFLADRTERHGARGKSLHDRLDGLDLLERNRLVGKLEVQ